MERLVETRARRGGGGATPLMEHLPRADASRVRHLLSRHNLKQSRHASSNPPPVILSPPCGRRISAVSSRQAGILRGVYPERNDKDPSASPQDDSAWALQKVDE